MKKGSSLSKKLMLSIGVISFMAILGPVSSAYMLNHIGQQSKQANDLYIKTTKNSEKLKTVVDLLPSRSINLDNPQQLLKVISELVDSPDLLSYLVQTGGVLKKRSELVDQKNQSYTHYMISYNIILKERQTSQDNLFKASDLIRAQLISLVADIRRKISKVVQQSIDTTVENTMAIYVTDDIEKIVRSSRDLGIDVFELEDLIEAKTAEEKSRALSKFRSAVIEDVGTKANSIIGKTDTELQEIIGNLAKRNDQIQKATLSLSQLGNLVDNLLTSENIEETDKSLRQIIKNRDIREMENLYISIENYKLIEDAKKIQTLDRELEQNQKIIIDITDKINDLVINYTNDDLQKASNLLVATDKNATIISVALVVLSIITAITVVLILEFIIRRNVLKPLVQANTILSDVLDGKTVRRLKSLPDNEIGKIIQAAYEIEEERTAKEQSLQNERTQRQIIKKQSQEVSDAIGEFNAKTHSITRDLDTVMDSVAESSDELLKISENVSQQTTKTNNMATEALSSINHSQNNLHSIVDAIKAINTKSHDLKNISTAVQTETQTTSQSVTTLSKTLGQISESSKSITDIAKQSRLLALNARIETQHENNNGFAVIAEEVKQVSSQIQNQSQNISDISNKTVNITAKAKESIEKLNTITHKTFELAKLVNDQTLHSLENAEQILSLGQGTIEKVQRLVDFINVVDQGTLDTKNSTRELNEQFLKALAINRELLMLIKEFSNTVDKIINR